MAKIFIKTFGCAQNKSDSETMAGILVLEGHKILNDEFNSDVVIINSCTVKNEAESKLFREIRKHQDKKVVIAGCVAQAQKEIVENKLKDYSVIGTKQIDKIGVVVEQILKGNRLVFLDDNKKDINLPKIRFNKIVEIISISEGCLGNCTYCKAKQARGELSSYSKNDILKIASKALNEGVKEIWLTSQDTGAYGLDIGETLPKLLNELLSLKGDFKIRLGMCNPNFFIKYLEELVEILNHEKMFSFVHIPIQSGNDKILKLMNRQYSKSDFEFIYKTLKNKVNNITIATDIIVGFPTETITEFNETYDLMSDLKPEIVNISRFWKRPNTKAETFKQVDSKSIKERSKKLMDKFKEISFENNQSWIGWEGPVIIEEKGINNNFTARNFAYKPVIVGGDNLKLGDIVNVKIKKASTWDIRV